MAEGRRGNFFDSPLPAKDYEYWPNVNNNIGMVRWLGQLDNHWK